MLLISRAIWGRPMALRIRSIQRSGGKSSGLSPRSVSPVCHDGSHASIVLLEGDQFSAEAQVAPTLTSSREQNRFALVLGTQAPVCRADFIQGLSRRFCHRDPLEFSPGERLHDEYATIV